MPTVATILSVSAVGLGAVIATGFEITQARKRDRARRERKAAPQIGCGSYGPVYSLAGQPVGQYVGPGGADCWPDCPSGYNLIDTDDGPRCASTTELPDVGPSPAPTPPEPEPIPPPKPGPSPDYPPYVGSGWTGWPHKNWFFDEASFSEVLMNLGYLEWASTCLTADGRFLAQACGAIVGAFQEDFNLVRDYVREAQNMFMAIEPLELTEKLDTPTITALLHALRIEDEAGATWADVVSAADTYFS